MSEEKKIPDLSQNQLKGINIAIKSVFRKYNFLVDWKFPKDAFNWGGSIYIDLVVDLNKLSDLIGLPIRQFAKDRLKMEEYLSTILLIPLEFDLSTENEEKEKILEKSRNIKSDMEDIFNLVYENLPDEMRMKWKLPQYDNLYTKKIHINDFKFILK